MHPHLSFMHLDKLFSKIYKKRIVTIFAFSLMIGLISFFTPIHLIWADTTCNDTSDQCIQSIGQEINQLNTNLQNSINATKPLEGQLEAIKVQLNQIQIRLNNLSDQIGQREEDIKVREDKLATQQVLLDSRVRAYYIQSFLVNPLIMLLSSNNTGDLIREMTYSQATTAEDQRVIGSVTLDMVNLANEKAKLEKDKASLASFQAQVDKNAQYLGGVITTAKAYQKDLETKIASLTAQQQSLIAAKSGNFNVSVGSAALADDPNASLSGWQSNAPSGSVTVFSFGAYAGNGSNFRRNGMSQYGAWARAKAGQDYNAILQAYYGSTPIQRSMPATINTDQGTMPFETQYLYGIAEMPASWTDNNLAALKAQAIAARTYAYHYIQSGSTICTSDHCQVYDASKGANPPQAWKDAVDQTKGMILPDGVSAQYVSTPGGYLDTKGWDTTCNNGGCLSGGAYDSSSPWFYKAWYSNYRYGSGFSTCDRNNPWLSQEDITDILNAWVVYTKGTSDDQSHILPADNCGGGSPYSISQMKDRANALGGAYSSVNGVSVSQNGGGYTADVTFQTDRGDLTLPGFDVNCSHPGGGCKDFWTIFALRAPGNISIKSRLFDVRIK